MTYLVIALSSWGTPIPFLITDSLDYAEDTRSTEEKKLGMGWTVSILPVHLGLSDAAIVELYDGIDPDELAAIRNTDS